MKYLIVFNTLLLVLIITIKVVFLPGQLYLITEHDAVVRLRSSELPALLRVALAETPGARAIANSIGRKSDNGSLVLVWDFELRDAKHSRFETSIYSFGPLTSIVSRYDIVSAVQAPRFDLLVNAAMSEHVNAVMDQRVFDSATAMRQLAIHDAINFRPPVIDQR